MKKALIALAIIIPVLLAVALWVVWSRADEAMGLSLAEAVSHDTLAPENTRLRVVLHPDKLVPLLLQHLPADLKNRIPSWVPWSLDDAIPNFMPYEVALLSRIDYAMGDIKMLFFINERRGGPFLTGALNDSNLFNMAKMIRWAPERLRLERRGVMTAQGSLPLPFHVEQHVLEIWGSGRAEPPVLVQGGHLIEVALDNRNGDALALVETMATQAGLDAEKMWEDPNAKIGLELIKQITVARMYADLAGSDRMNLHLRLEAPSNASDQLSFVAEVFILPLLKTYLNDQLGLTLEGNTKWDAAQSALTGDFALSGFEAKIAEATQGAIG